MSAVQREVTAIKVHQWLPEWDKVKFSASEEERRRKPAPFFYLFSLSAKTLKKLSDVQPRKAEKPRIEDIGIQRVHDKKRSQEIARFVLEGFPLSADKSRTLHSTDQPPLLDDFEEGDDRRMPGWLPTAIIANIRPANTKRGNDILRPEDAIRIQDIDNDISTLILPKALENSRWNPKIYPLQIIDGQHRLWAFVYDSNIPDSFQLPVVAFYDLDVTWQAYLFYTINIKPVRINASLAYDLYPILRIQSWLEKSPDGATIYRETRAQELTEVLWSHPESPWKGRINMLGERGGGDVTQAAFIRALTNTFIKRWEGKRISIGGLFASALHLDKSDPLGWNRPQQAAFLVFAWRMIANAVKKSRANWAKHLRQLSEQNPQMRSDQQSLDVAFAGRYSFFATEQGVRGYMHIINDMLFVAADDLGLAHWQGSEEIEEDRISESNVSEELTSLQKVEAVSDFLKRLTNELANFDWRIPSTPDLEEDERLKQSSYRGAPGYKEMRRSLLKHLQESKNSELKKYASEVIHRLGY